MSAPASIAKLDGAFVESFGLDAGDVSLVEEAIGQLKAAAAAEARLLPEGEARILAYIRKHLARLATIAADRKSYPKIAEVQIARPIILMGAPRSGTTFFHSLLSQDPQFRSPLSWEVEFPSPPPEGAHLLDDPRVARWAERQSGADATVGRDLRDKELLKKHLIGATLPEECGIMLGASLRSPSGFWTLARLEPYHRWLIDTQMEAAYQLHKHWLQHLQYRAPRPYWLLKYPLHTHALEALVATYPDAVLIETHRNPEETVSSFASLMSTLRRGALTPEDPSVIGREMLEAQAEGVEKSMAYRARHGAGAIVDVSYQELLVAPLAVVARFYDQLGLTLTTEVEERLATFVRENPQGKHGEHKHNLADYGLGPEEVRERMGAYVEAFAPLLEAREAA